MLNNYVISLATAQDRRQHIQQEFGKQKVAFQFFDAFYPSAALDAAMERFCPALIHSDKLTLGEKGCLISHLALWQKCVDEQLPYVAIFEDDVYLGKNAFEFLNEGIYLEQRFNHHAFVLRLEASHIPAEHLHCAIISPFQEREFLILNSLQYGTAAYIISQAAAKLLLQKIYALQESEIKPIDHIMFEDYLNQKDVLMTQLSPALAIQICLTEQNFLSSSLEKERSLRYIRKETTPTSRLKRLCGKLNLNNIIKRKAKREAMRMFYKWQEQKQSMIPFY